MTRLLLVILFLFSFGSAHGQITRDNIKKFDKLTEAQKAEIVQRIEKLTNSNDNPISSPANTAETVRTWASIGTELGRGLVATAKELGVAANEFIKTPLGVLSAGIILWHYMGRDLIHIAAAIVFILVYFPTWFYIFKRALLVERITYEDGGKIGPFTRRIKLITYRSWRDMPGEGIFLAFIGAIAAVLVPLILVVTI